MIYDLIVVGGGPAGMTAALYARRNGKTVLVLEQNGFGGQITYSPKVENIPGFLSLSGNEFAERFLDQILAQGAEVELEKVTSLSLREDGIKVVTTEEGTDYEARAVVLATGVKHRLLGLEGEVELIGNGISFCAVCDGDFYADQTVCVIGGGNSALQEAILLAGKCKEVIVVQDLPALTGEKALQEILFARPNVRTVTSQRVNALVTENGVLHGIETEHRETGEKQTIACDGLFVAIGLIPENAPFASFVPLDERGYFKTDETCLTPTPGIFTAGDCRAKAVRQVTTAASDGAQAALAACRYLDGLAAK